MIPKFYIHIYVYKLSKGHKRLKVDRRGEEKEGKDKKGKRSIYNIYIKFFFNFLKNIGARSQQEWRTPLIPALMRQRQVNL